MNIGKEGSLAKRGKGRQLGKERERKAAWRSEGSSAKERERKAAWRREGKEGSSPHEYILCTVLHGQNSLIAIVHST